MNNKVVGLFRPIEFNEISKIKVEFALAPVPKWDHSKILKISFSGEYGIGSAGNPDARYMGAMVEAAMTVFSPDGVINDFSKLKYEWGDQLSEVLYAPSNLSHLSPEPAFAIVTGNDCEPAIKSLLEDMGDKFDEATWIFRDLAQAQSYVQDIIIARNTKWRLESDARRNESDKEFWDLLGEEIGLEICREPECTRKRIKDSVLCRTHHFEQYRGRKYSM